MARKYFFKFKTIQDHVCRVDIYDDNYTGDAIELNKTIQNSPGCPTDSPVIIEEDNSENLYDFVRTKTGYINLIELQDGALSDLFPINNKTLRLYIFKDADDSTTPSSDAADTTMIFQGFIQSQSFNSDLVKYRNELKIPFISTMGVIGENKLSTMATAIRDIMHDNLGEYKYIVFPTIKFTPTGSDVESDDLITSHLLPSVIYPYNKDYNFGIAQYQGDNPQPYSPITVMEFVDKLCSVRGLTAHEVGNTLVFFSQEYSHMKYVVSDLSGDYTQTQSQCTSQTISVFNLFEFIDNDSKRSDVLPASIINLEWTEEENPIELNLDVVQGVRPTNYGYAILEYMGHNISSEIWTTEVSAPDNSLRLIGYDDEGGVTLEARANTDRGLFSIEFETPDPLMSIGWYSGHHYSLHIATKDERVGTLEVSIQSGGKWLNFDYDPEQGDDEWIDTQNWYGLTLATGSTNDFYVNMLSNDKTCTVFFRSKDTSVQALYYPIERIYIEYKNSANKYLSSLVTKNGRRINRNTGTDIEDEINVDFWYYAREKNIVYNYLLNGGINLTLNLRKKPSTSISDLMMQLAILQITGFSGQFRVLSICQNLIDDIYKIQAIKLNNL